MREVRRTSRFQRDYKREISGKHGKTLDAALLNAVERLAADRSPTGTSITHSPASGRITEIATSNQI